jgi:hypothetical protein
MDALDAVQQVVSQAQGGEDSNDVLITASGNSGRIPLPAGSITQIDPVTDIYASKD